MHKGNNCKTCEIPTGVKYLIQCSVCSSNGKWRLFSSESGRGGEWQWPGSGTMRSPPSPYGIAALSTGILMWRWRRLKVQVFIHELLVRCRLFGVTAFFLRLTPISIHFLCFCHEDIGGWGAHSCLEGDNVVPFPPLSHGQPSELLESRAERRLGWTVLNTDHGLRGKCPLSSPGFCLNSSFLAAFPSWTATI